MSEKSRQINGVRPTLVQRSRSARGKMRFALLLYVMATRCGALPSPNGHMDDVRRAARLTDAVSHGDGDEAPQLDQKLAVSTISTKGSATPSSEFYTGTHDLHCSMYVTVHGEYVLHPPLVAFVAALLRYGNSRGSIHFIALLCPP